MDCYSWHTWRSLDYQPRVFCQRFWFFTGCVSVEKWFTPSNSCFPSQVQIDGALQNIFISLQKCHHTPQVSLKSWDLCSLELWFSLLLFPGSALAVSALPNCPMGVWEGAALFPSWLQPSPKREKEKKGKWWFQPWEVFQPVMFGQESKAGSGGSGEVGWSLLCVCVQNKILTNHESVKNLKVKWAHFSFIWE